MNAPAKAKHTPGPWETSVCQTDTGVEWTVSGPNGGDMIADLSQCDNAEANARLSAAAPEMLDALKGLTHGLPELLKSIGYTDEEHLIEKALAVIAKAEPAQ